MAIQLQAAHILQASTTSADFLQLQVKLRWNLHKNTGMYVDIGYDQYINCFPSLSASEKIHMKIDYLTDDFLSKFYYNHYSDSEMLKINDLLPASRFAPHGDRNKQCTNGPNVEITIVCIIHTKCFPT